MVGRYLHVAEPRDRPVANVLEIADAVIGADRTDCQVADFFTSHAGVCADLDDAVEIGVAFGLLHRRGTSMTSNGNGSASLRARTVR